MAIQIPDAGTGNGATGDNEFVLWTKVINNFSAQTNAASRLVGTGAEQIPLSKNIPSLLGTAATKDVGTASGNVMTFGFQRIGETGYSGADRNLTRVSSVNTALSNDTVPHLSKYVLGDDGPLGYPAGIFFRTTLRSGFSLLFSQLNVNNADKFPRVLLHQGIGTVNASTTQGDMLLLGINATKDSNGFLKGASPVVDLYDDTIDLNQDAEQQGGITFEKLGVGDYLIKGSLGFAQDGWHIETPKDTNGNVLVAVVETQLANNDLSIKAYAKRFDDETGDIVPNLTKPRDIPDGRFISLRLHELPVEIEVDIQTEEAGLDK